MKRGWRGKEERDMRRRVEEKEERGEPEREAERHKCTECGMRDDSVTSTCSRKRRKQCRRLEHGVEEHTDAARCAYAHSHSNKSTR